MPLPFALPIAWAALAAAATPPGAQLDLAAGFDGALRGCEEWILRPASWASGPAPFVAAVGLGDRMGLVETVDAAALPPPQLRRANHYWRINSTPRAGYILVVSDQLPMCHITGGGDTDLQPIMQSALAAPAFAHRWEQLGETSYGDMTTTAFRHREEQALTLTVSRAKTTGQRLDRVQVMATAIFKTSR